MSFLDAIAVAGLIVAGASAVLLFIMVGAAPGRVAQNRGHSWAEGVHTDHLQASHIIRQVVLRQEAIPNYVVPF